MELLTSAPDYRDILKRELEERCRRNPKYSLRSFARDLEMAPARLSDVLRARYGISPKAAVQIANKLGYGPCEAASFCDLVTSQHGRTPKSQEAARNRVQARGTSYQQLTQDAFHVIADWYHYAILELTLLDDFQSDLAWLGARLKISLNIVKPAIERLERLKLLEFKNSHWVATDNFTASTSDVPSAALKKFHQQVLERALTALYTQDVHERDFSSMVMAIDKADLPAAKEEIKAFRRGFDLRFGKAKSKNSIYCLTTQFFRLDEKE